MGEPRRLKSGKWQATVYLPNGKRITRTHTLKRVVAAWADEKRAQIQTGNYTAPKDGRLRLTEWWDRWQSVRRVEVATHNRNESQWRCHVRPKFGDWPLSAITSWEIEGWVTDMGAEGTGPETVASSLRLLRLMLAEAVRHRLIPTNPAELVTAPTPPKHVDRYITPDERDRLLEHLKDRDRVFVALLFECGPRWSECAALRVRHVDFLKRELVIEKSLRRDGSEKDPKTESGVRRVPISDELLVELSKYVQGRGREDRLFGDLSYTNWRRRVWVPACERAGLDEPLPTAHDARHAYGSWLGGAGMGAADIARLMGHKSTRSTERYVHATPERFDRARAAIAATKGGAL